MAKKNEKRGLSAYDVLYNLALVMWALLFAGCAYCAALMYLMTSGICSTLWGVACVFWLAMLMWYVGDCFFGRRKHKRRRRVEKRGAALRSR